jgi:hypothetical protein
MTVLELDSFQRGAVSNGWGTATDGDNWYVSQGAASSLSTTGTQGKITGSSGTRSHLRLGDITDSNMDVYARFTPSTTGEDFGVTARSSGDASIAGVSCYRFDFSSGHVALYQVYRGTSTQLGSNVSKTVAANSAYWQHIRVIGSNPVQIFARQWADGTTEPSTWDITQTDNTASKITAGAPGVTGIASSTGWKIDNFSADDGTGGASVGINLSNPAAQMESSDLATEYDRIRNAPAGQTGAQIAIIYYGASTYSQAIYGELDVIFPWEQVAQFHTLNSINDVTAFLQQYEYCGNVYSDNPVLYYRLDESGGAIANDLTPHNLDGAYVGNITYNAPDALAVSTDSAVTLDGSTAYIQAPAGLNMGNWTAYSLECWFNPGASVQTSSPRIFSSDNPTVNNTGCELVLSASGSLLTYNYGYQTTGAPTHNSLTIGSSVASANTWYHLVLTMTGTTVTAYVNGAAFATQSVSGTALLVPSSYPLCIGYQPSTASKFFSGSIDEFAVYNYALSASQVLAHYTSGVTP